AMSLDIDIPYKLGIGLASMMFAYILATPEREGVWILTYAVYGLARLVMPTAILRGIAFRAKVHVLSKGIQVSDTHRLFASKWNILKPLRPFAGIPIVSTTAPGLFHLNPGGARAMLKIEG